MCETLNTTSIMTGAGFPVALKSASEFVGQDGVSIRGTIRPDFIHITSALVEEKDLILQAKCIPNDQTGLISNKRSSPCSLSIIIYGPMELLDDVGEFFQKYEMFIQDPEGCDRTVRYCNPHRLSSCDLDSCPLTSEIGDCQGLVELHDMNSRTEQMDIFVSQEELPETPQPRMIKTTLEK